MKIADISQHDHPIDWNIARKELELIIFRASIGTDTIDKRYIEYTTQCGVPYGAYHYVKAGTAKEAKIEAKFFVESANKAIRKPLFYIADIEYEAQTETTTEAVCVAFLQQLRELGCKKIGLYINRRYKYAGKAINLCDIIWIPHWGANDGNIPSDSSKPKYYNDIWQYTSEGTVNGIDETVDLNLLNGNKNLNYFIEGWIQPTEDEMIYLKKKSSGDNVKELQKNLNLLFNIKLTEDGIFGSKTEEALKQFQKMYNLEETGIYDKQNHTILTNAISKIEKRIRYIINKSTDVYVSDNINSKIITTYRENTEVDMVLNLNKEPILSFNNWYAIYVKKQIGWVEKDTIKII